MPGDAVTFEEKDHVGIITLNRPEVHNAVDAAMMKGLETALDELDRHPDLRALILTGAGNRSFCAGGDLKYFASLESQEQGLEMSRRMSEVLRRLAGGPRPVIAAVNGDALGGGCEVLVACHLRLAVSAARFSFRQAAMGVVTGWGGGLRVLRLLGKSRALRLLLTAVTIDAFEARRIALVDFVVEEPDRLMDEALELARRIAANAPESIAAFLDLARTYEEQGGSAAERREAELFGQGWVGEHFRRKVAEWTAKGKSRLGADSRPKRPTTPDAAIAALLEGNERYVNNLARPSENTPEARRDLVAGQSPFAALIRCADSRVSPEIVFDQPLGNLFVCGVAGNIPTTEIIASLEYGVAVLETKVIVVMGHSSCGAVSEAIKNRNDSSGLPGSLPQLIDQIVLPSALDADDPDLSKAIACNANMGVRRLMRRSPVLEAAVEKGDLEIIAGVLDLESGRFEIMPHAGE